jgi:polar amino acid transport system substrate-binding protein
MFIPNLRAAVTFFSSLILTTTLIQAEESVRITSGEWPPFLSEQLEHYGVGARIVTEAFKAANYNIEYGFFPWSKSIELARAGIWQGSAIWTFNKERANFFYFSDPLFESDEGFFHLKSKKFDWSKWKDLKPYKIGGTGGIFLR